MTALLDTHILIWWLNDSNRLSPAQQEVVASASAESPLLVSDISLWEVATLHSLGRIQLTIPLRVWLDKAVAPPLVRRHGISPAHCGGAGHVARLLSTRSSRPNPRGDRPNIRRDAVDAGSQNRRRSTGQHVALTAGRRAREPWASPAGEISTPHNGGRSQHPTTPKLGI